MKHHPKMKLVLLCSNIICIVLVAAVMMLYFDTKPSNTYEVICASNSTDGKYRIEIMSYGDPLFFAPHTIGIKICSTEDHHPNGQDVIQTEVANDGGPVKEDDVSFLWNGDTVIIKISASEQPDVTYQISFHSDHSYALERKFADVGAG